LTFAEVPSPKFQVHAVGELSVVSVNWTACPVEAGFGLIEKCGSGSVPAGAATTTFRETDALPAELVALSVTVKVPAETKTCVGLCTAEVPPSPKVQAQDVGAPLETSVNWTDWLVAGADGEYENAATGTVAAGLTVTVLVEEALPDALVAVRRTE
jgi:hypothetical protein